MKHSLVKITTKTGNESIDYRPVSKTTLSDEVEFIPPKKRVY
jgi:succinate dehydrogenase / fumarate reductase flavoprotein subunit